MANSFDTSFIPQQPLLKVEGSERHSESVNIALVLAFVIFFVTLAVWGGMYLYKTGIDRRVLASEKELASKESILKTDEIARYKLIDERLNVAKELLRGHIAFSTILTLLEKITAQDVGLTALSYATSDVDGSVNISLSGQAPSYSAVYAQAEAWRDMQTLLQKVEVSMPQLDPVSGVVSFGATLTVDPSYVKYARTLKGGEGSASITAIETATTPASTDPTNTSLQTP